MRKQGNQEKVLMLNPDGGAPRLYMACLAAFPVRRSDFRLSFRVCETELPPPARGVGPIDHIIEVVRPIDRPKGKP